MRLRKHLDDAHSLATAVRVELIHDAAVASAIATSHDVVLTIEGAQVIVAVHAPQDVLATPTDDEVVATEPSDDVVAVRADETIDEEAAVDDVRAVKETGAVLLVMASVAMLIIGRSRSPDREEADRQHKNSHDSLHRMRPFLSVLVVMMLIAVGPSSQSYATGGASRWRTAEIVPWYGPGFYGNRTACGQRLTRWTRGVAHRTLPCGTRIQLRKGGEWVTTRVIDRGPYPARHLYDEMPLDLTARTNCWDLNGGTYLDPCHSRTNVRWRVLR